MCCFYHVSKIGISTGAMLSFQPQSHHHFSVTENWHAQSKWSGLGRKDLWRREDENWQALFLLFSKEKKNTSLY